MSSTNGREKRLVEKAQDYALRGWPVFPVHGIKNGCCTCGQAQACSSPGGHPRTSEGQHEATTDSMQITRWWEESLDAHIGLSTGARSGIWVLHADGVAGLGALAALERQYTQLPATPRAKTANGGCHWYFRYPRNQVVRTASRLGGLPLDVHGDGGFVVAPPRSLSE